MSESRPTARIPCTGSIEKGQMQEGLCGAAFKRPALTCCLTRKDGDAHGLEALGRSLRDFITMLDGLKERAKFKGLTEAIDSERRQPLQVADDRLIERVRAQPDLEAEAVRTGVRQSPNFHRGLVEAIV